MKITYIGENSFPTIMEHTRNMTLNIEEDSQAVVVESPLIKGEVDLPVLNTSNAVRSLIVNDEYAEEFNKLYNIVNGHPDSYIYGFINETGLSRCIEIASSSRFMTGGIGPRIGLVQGAALACKEDIHLALPSLPALIEALVAMEYRGEITLGITNEYQICSLSFGHNTAGLALYTELLRGNIQNTYEWCLGKSDPPALHNNGIALITLVSSPPYPHRLDIKSYVRAPVSAEKHLYRLMIGKCEVAYAGAWGTDLFETKRRVRKTLQNCALYDNDTQYRVDFGVRDKFVLNKDRYITFGGHSSKQSS